MMKYAVECIEQLDLAAQQLGREGPSFARFALMLSDNMVELMLHAECEDAILLDQMFPDEAKFDNSARRRALGRWFEEKARLCLAVERLTQDEFDLVNICHDYRNEVYHAGVRHERILLPLAWHYHKLACELFRRSRPLVVELHPGNRPLSEAVLRHAGDLAKAGMLRSDDLAATAADSLDACRPALDELLSDCLTAAAESKLDDVERDLAFLIKNSTLELNEVQMIEHVEFYDHIYDETAAGYVDPKRFASVAQMVAHQDRVRLGWSPRYRVNPNPGWRARVPKISSAESAIASLRRYEQLRRETEFFERIVSEAAAEMDLRIQQEVDRRLGK